MEFISRASGILLRPNSEWVAIAQEKTTSFELRAKYLVPWFGVLVATDALRALYEGEQVTGNITKDVVFFGLLILGTLLFAGVVNMLAPVCASTKNSKQAYQLAVYSSTALIVMRILYSLIDTATSMYPVGMLVMNAGLVVLGMVYTAYLLYQGLPALMHTPQSKRMRYVLYLVLFAVVGAVSVLFADRALFGGVSPGFVSMLL